MIRQTNTEMVRNKNRKVRTGSNSQILFAFYLLWATDFDGNVYLN